ncbi:hypothetical protein ACIQZM_06450 [Peribacillus sp. NPDC097206]|uniref:hypothetical protein n=1 Tax=Peribacillus sp. NPDC097206 TaxID=3364398 RepID=UPI0038142857
MSILFTGTVVFPVGVLPDVIQSFRREKRICQVSWISGKGILEIFDLKYGLILKDG